MNQSTMHGRSEKNSDEGHPVGSAMRASVTSVPCAKSTPPSAQEVSKLFRRGKVN